MTLRIPAALLTLSVAASLAAAPSCEDETLTLGEAKIAVEEVALTSSGDSLLGVTVDLSTDFTIGEGLERAAETLREFAASQVPCATVAVSGATVTVTFGALSDLCLYRGQLYGGTIAWTVEKAAADQIVVKHAWTDFHNARAHVTGAATVTWNLTAVTRQVVHAADWTVDGRSFHAEGDRLQSLLDPTQGLWAGIRVDGTRAWTGDRGRWDLAIEGTEIQWDYALPVAGRYVLTNPDGKILTLTFTKVDDVTIRATLTGTRKEYVFNVSKLGAVTTTAQ